VKTFSCPTARRPGAATVTTRVVRPFVCMSHANISETTVTTEREWEVVVPGAESAIGPFDRGTDALCLLTGHAGRHVFTDLFCRLFAP